MSAQWTEGVCGDGAAILRDGVMVPIEKVVEALNQYEALRATLAWREDAWGKPERALYLGRICVGSVMHIRAAKPRTFRAWIQDSEEGSTVGWFATEQEARDALSAAVLKAMRGE